MMSLDAMTREVKKIKLHRDPKVYIIDCENDIYSYDGVQYASLKELYKALQIDDTIDTTIIDDIPKSIVAIRDYGRTV